MSKSIVMSMNDWDTGAVRYMQPKLNERGGKSINVISTQTNRSLHVSTPLLMTWGISDFVGENVPIISDKNIVPYFYPTLIIFIKLFGSFFIATPIKYF